MLVLSVNIHEEFAGLAQLRQRRRATVDEAAGASRGIDHAPRQEYAFVTGEFVPGQPLLKVFQSGDVEFGADLCAIRALAYRKGVTALAQHQRQRVDENGFTGTGLAREHREPRGEFEIHALDDNKVANVQAA